ncbi:DMT family transporter [Nitratireductor sp. CH_MIT9313-5]|uniref:DMT family transporter n=1 Tax=Nitratireductor sp. CH_MIT9313-5 TaxID=3107764 RepID=UPI00300896B8
MKTTWLGFINGLLGVAIFSGSLPATRLAVAGFDPLFLTAARALLAGILAVGIIAALRPARPHRNEVNSLAVIAAGVVVGFPLLTALALETITAARSIVFIGLLPIATAIFGAMRGGDRPHPMFWLFSVLGSSLVAGYAVASGGGQASSGDLYMLAAILICGLGYAEGAHLSRSLGGWQVICWALILSLPFMFAGSLFLLPATWDGISISSWAGLAYVSVFSMLVGFIFWYRGLAQGGTAAVSQLQLLQPFMGLCLAALILGETIDPLMGIVTFGVICSVALARRYAKRYPDSRTAAKACIRQSQEP